MLKNAIRFAINAHHKQKRKGTDFPYIEHPIHVGMLLQQIGASEEIVVAGILHDTLEDTEVTEADILVEFGERVLYLVKWTSEPDKSLPWKERKSHTLVHLATAERYVQLIALCDKYANLIDMATDLKQEGTDFWMRFNAGLEAQRWYYESLVESLEGLSDLGLYHDFCQLVAEVFAD